MDESGVLQSFDEDIESVIEQEERECGNNHPLDDHFCASCGTVFRETDGTMCGSDWFCYRCLRWVGNPSHGHWEPVEMEGAGS